MGLKRSLKVTNVVLNSNFANGTTECTANSSTHSVTDNILLNTGNGASSAPYEIVNTKIKPINNNRYYIRANILITDAVCLKIWAALDTEHASSMQTAQTNTPTQNQWYSISGVITWTNNYETETLRLQARRQYADATTANGKEMKIKELLVVEISTLPTEVQALSSADLKTWCDINLPYYFNNNLAINGNLVYGGVFCSLR